MKKISVKMKSAIVGIIKPFTNNIEECDGRNLNGVAISIKYEDEDVKEAPARFYDYAIVTIQDVRWDGTRSRHECDGWVVCHNGECFKR